MIGVASCRCVRPIFTIAANALALSSSASRRRFTEGSTALRTASTAATEIAVGNTSLLDCPLLTSSLGWTLRSSPRTPPSSSLARLASTSFMFMFDCVPEPVCQTTSGNSSGCLPASTSSAAATIALAFAASSAFRSTFTCAAAFFTSASAAMSSRGIWSRA